MKKSLVIAFVLLLGVCITTASAVEVTRFGPKQYVCEKGKPQTITNSFTADHGRGWFIVENGDAGGHHRVSGAVITLNGKKVVGLWTFKRHDRHHKNYVHLRESNTLSVKVHGRPGSYITIRVIQDVPIEISINAPEYGATVAGPTLRVEGTVVHPLGYETGITVYPHTKKGKPVLPHHRPKGKKHHHPLRSKYSHLGIAAMVYGDQFVASHVPVQEGRNILTVIATDTDGNVAGTCIKVHAVVPKDYISLEATPETGVAPLETTLRIKGSFSFTASNLTYTGPGEVQIIENPGPQEYLVRITTEGVYNITVQAVNAENNTFTDTVTVMVLNRAELDAMLQAKWDGMKSALVNQDIEKALQYFADDTEGLYRDIYTALGNNLPQIVQDMQDIQFIYAEGRMAKYRIRRNEEHGGQVYPITYYIYFVRDRDGLWKIYRY